MADRGSRQNSKALIYLYGITQGAPKAAVRAPGVDALAEVEPVAASGLTCWISHVPAAVFGDSLARHMENLEWLAEASVRHQGAVAAIAAHSDILPARFGTVFRDEKSLQRHVSSGKNAILSALKKIAGADEWGIKVFAERRAVAVPVGVRSGREYLERKAALLPERKSAAPDEQILVFARALSEIADATAGGGPVSAGQRNLVWQGSFLVRRARQKKWQEALKRFATDWGDERRIECTGPWPPYSFARGQES